MNDPQHSIQVKALSKSYGALQALDNIDLTINKGEIFALLGPNGAGKTTLIRILTTLMRPTSGSSFITGLDTTQHGREIRRLIGVVPQENSLDRYLTARENLELHARLHSIKPKEYRRRIDDLLELFGLSSRQHDFPDTYSGGMQRRLVVARALIHQPKVLFLDEPTTGLDPQSRRAVWDYIRSLAGGMTIFLTTHYLEEVDHLCERVAIMDHGKLIALGSTEELKRKLSNGATYEIEIATDVDLYASAINKMSCIANFELINNTITVHLERWECLSEVIEALKGAVLRRISLKEKSLEEVFISLTGSEVRE
jgi:ABC-2 type transport system ATP-binding protein